jgi:hypothetical protein
MSDTVSINDLFGGAHNEGNLSKTSLDILTGVDVGSAIMDGMGVSVDDVHEAKETILLGLMPDDSGSIRFSGNSEAVRNGCNLVVESLQKTKQKKGILALNRYLNGTILYPFCPIEQAVLLTTQNYNPNQQTPLYDQTVRFLGTMLAKSEEFKANGVHCRTISLIVTDGADLSSVEMTPAKVASIVRDMLQQENHIVAAMGIDDGETDFKKVFIEMGIPPEWIITPNKGEILAAFQCFSQSAVQASQGVNSFSKTSSAGLGGFGN